MSLKIKIKPLDRLWSKAVKKRDGGRCRICGKIGKPRGMHAAHIEGRAKKNTRWYIPNGLTLCFTCHRWFDEHKGIRDKFMEEKGIMTAKKRLELTVMANMTWDKDVWKWKIYLDSELKS